MKNRIFREISPPMRRVARMSKAISCENGAFEVETPSRSKYTRFERFLREGGGRNLNGVSRQTKG
jgi:hypothetical protein